MWLGDWFGMTKQNNSNDEEYVLGTKHDVLDAAGGWGHLLLETEWRH